VFNSRVRVIAPDHGGNLRTQPDLSRSMLYARQLHRSCALLFEERPQPPVFVLFSRQNSNRDPPTSAAFHAINACPKAVGKKSVQRDRKVAQMHLPSVVCFELISVLEQIPQQHFEVHTHLACPNRTL
jgi:hypothetical protein